MATPDQLLAEEFTKQLSVTLEGMLGQSWTIESKEAVSPEKPAEEKKLHIWGQRLTIHADPLFRVMVAIPTKPNTIPEASRTGFRSEVEQRSERSDAGILIVE